MSLKYQTTKQTLQDYHCISHSRHGILHNTKHYAMVELNDKCPKGQSYRYGIVKSNKPINIQREYLKQINECWDDPVKMRDIPPQLRVEWLRFNAGWFPFCENNMTKDIAIKHLQLKRNPKGKYRAGVHGKYDWINNPVEE